MSGLLQNKVCLVTGASRGIGAAIAAALAAEGAGIGVHYGSNRNAAEKVVEGLAGNNHAVFAADLSDAAVAPDLVNRVIHSLGRLDVLVNNAGIFKAHDPLGVSTDQWLQCWREILEVNLIGPAVLCQSAAASMAAQGGGRIINIGSRGAFRGEPEGPAYGASKAGLHSLSQSLAIALAPHNIQVTAVAPGFVETDMASALLEGETGDAIRGQSPLNRVARPDEIAETVRFLATTDAQFLTGAIIDVNGASYLRT
ncbi:MAG: SDR family NAD(P)-dependent oxidoreductase [Woeseiaceae bacterium]